MKIGYTIVIVAAVMFFLASPSGEAMELSQTGQPVSHLFGFEPAEVTGFGAAQFGMTVDEVIAIALRDYREAVVERNFDPVRQTALVHVRMPRLAPTPESPALGPVSITYVFGYTSDRLIAVNLNWYTEGDATAAEREALLAAGTAYVARLLGHFWEPFSTFRGLVAGPNAVLLFAGRDEADRGIEVVVDGVDLEVVTLPEGVTTFRPAPPGPARLRIGLSERPDDPDVFTIPAGDF